MNKIVLTTVYGLLASGSLMCGSAQAATINFGPATGIVTGTDVSLVGTFNRAYVFGGGATTVNGVTFSPFAGNPAGDTETFGNQFGGFMPTATTVGGDTNYQALLTNGFYGSDLGGGADASITLNNLSIGTTYRVQLFVTDSRDCCAGTGANRSEVVNGSVQLFYNPTQQGSSSAGQYAIGTFTADATSQVITFNPTDAIAPEAQINGLFLSVVPEPASATAFALVSVGLLFYRRRNVRR